ncbi:MAG: hypothetical protein ACIAQZ_15135 [Sedimentisphaeraceae bacterium JB056]
MVKIKKYLSAFLLCLCVNICLSAEDCNIENKIENTKLPEANASIESFQEELLDIAFDTASLIPVKPHIKTRCKVQQYTIEAMLELKQLQKASDSAKEIMNWRKELCYAQIAKLYAEHNNIEAAEKYLKLAKQGLETKTLEEWRSDRIKVNITQAELLLGKDSREDGFEESLVVSEAGKVALIEAKLCDTDDFDKQCEALDKIIKAGVFDSVNNALKAYSYLYDNFYEDKEKRNLIENKIKNGWSRTPYFLRIDILERLIESSIKNNDIETALKNLETAKSYVDDENWSRGRIDTRMPLTAKVAKLYYKAGRKDIAVAELEKEVAAFEKNRETIVNMYRSEALCKVAEGYYTIGNKAKALEVYKMAAKEGMVNKNLRPRAEDFANLCCSMATNKVKPDDELNKIIRDITKELATE